MLWVFVVRMLMCVRYWRFRVEFLKIIGGERGEDIDSQLLVGMLRVWDLRQVISNLLDF